MTPVQPTAEPRSEGGSDDRKVRVSLTLTPGLIGYLDRLASADADLNRSLVVRRIVADHQRAYAAGRSAAAAVSPLLPVTPIG
jgi:hypothetical protein